MSDTFAILDDGFTDSGFLARVRGLHPDVRFIYRPCTTTERNDYYRRNTNASAAEQVRNGCKLLKDKVKSWDIKGKNGEVLPIDLPTLGKMQPLVFDRFILVVTGTEAGDPDPTKPASEQEEDADDSFRSA